MISIEDINKEVAKKLNISYSIVDEVNRSQYEGVVKAIKELKDSKLLYIGKIVKKGKYRDEQDK
jgi:hypothetical protein